MIEKTKIELNFTSQRGDIGVPNHHSVYLEKEFGLEFTENFYLSVSVGAQYMFDENYEKIEEGFYFNNELKVSYKW